MIDFVVKCIDFNILRLVKFWVFESFSVWRGIEGLLVISVIDFLEWW